ncbi:MAG: iron-containing alcohol dehydrogenase, partial [Terracidiphilus sp.]
TGTLRAVVVTGKSSATKNGYTELVTQHIPASDLAFYNEISPEPMQQEAERLAEYLAEDQPGIVIALGGGSVIDVAKVACSAAASGTAIADLMNRRVPPGPRRATLVAIPTTAGSGSELTPFAVLTNPATGLKQSLPSDVLYPDVAVMVPEFLTTVPRKIASDTGMDALAHAFEALWSVHSNPVSDGLAYKAIREIDGHFLQYLHSPVDLGHATAMGMAAALAGKAFSNTFTAGCHAMSYPIATRFSLSHGASCAVTLDLVARLNLRAVRQKYEVVCGPLSLRSPEQVPEYIASLRASTGCIPAFTGLGATPDDIGWIAENAFVPLLANNPVKLDAAVIRDVLR